MASHIVIAIDGPAASGKSSVARTLAKRLRYLYVNTGTMYRAITWHVVKQNVDVNDPPQVLSLLERAQIECGAEAGESTFTIDGIEPGRDLLSEAVNANVSTIARIPEVRARLVVLQRDYATRQNVVMEGRDIGSAVFPETPFKFYIDASVEVRAQRRHRQGLLDPIAARDRQDTSRHSSPLVIAEDAHVIDSSNLTVDGVVGEIIGRLKMKGFPLTE